ncbi:MAG: bifunctional folylpolyglutamate synthase/dihydrofolate synthase, partial [Pseudomonadales bacterium]
GLERVAQVAERMGFAAPRRLPAPRAVIVAGTNGKGSTCVALEALLRSAGLTVGTTLSPHVHLFNERVRINGEQADDQTLCAAFAAVDAARGEIPLTYFEFSALVAMHCFRDAAVDAAVLEVGLGGRLDAFNLVAADVAVVTSIGLDHQSYLGNDVETIGSEKAGVFRDQQRVVVGECVTASVLEAAAGLDCRLTRCGVDFLVHERADGWDYLGAERAFRQLPLGALAPHNCALAIEAAGHLVALDERQVRRALDGLSLPGRFETHWIGRDATPRLLLADVAHNPAGAGFLRQQLRVRYPGKRFVALFGMLDDKDATGTAAALQDLVAAWVCVPTAGARGLSGRDLATRLNGVAAPSTVIAVADVASGLAEAQALCSQGDGILAFGSFSLVEQVRDHQTHARQGEAAATMDLEI